MTNETSAYADWIKNLIKTCLPIELQKKILTLAPLTKQEAEKFAHVLVLAGQARQFQQVNKEAELLNNIGRKVNRLLDMSRDQLKNERAILWYTSSQDPKYKPTEGRETNAVRRVMVQYAQTLLAKDNTLTERSAANIVITKFSGVEGAYGPDELESFRRQINRTDPPK